MIIRPGAVFIADSHYSRNRIELITFLQKIISKEIFCTQLFLMGDIFDFLCDEIDYFQEINYEAIELIETISYEIETLYFEGNHDFSLEDTFPKVRVISREEQPLYVRQAERKVGLAHGDIYTPRGYNIYAKIIRNPYLLNFLNLVDIQNWLSKIVEKKLEKKDICQKQDQFEVFVQKRIEKYQVDLIIEGHFHQNLITNNYINIPAFGCSGEYLYYIDDEFKTFKV